MQRTIESLFMVCCSSFLFVVSAMLPAQVIAEAPASIKGTSTIGLEGARQLYNAGAVFIDVREKSSWELGHIPGALNLDFSDDSFVLLYSSHYLSKKTPIVFYNDSPLVSSGALASFFASNWGYSNVYFFREGYFSWMASDYPVEKSLSIVNKNHDSNFASVVR